jgi:hypothetical protein
LFLKVSRQNIHPHLRKRTRRKLSDKSNPIHPPGSIQILPNWHGVAAGPQVFQAMFCWEEPETGRWVGVSKDTLSSGYSECSAVP